MAVNWKNVEKQVKKTIADLGEKQTVTLEQPSNTPYDPTKPFEGPADSPTVYTPQAVVLAPPGVSFATRGSKSARDVNIDQTRGDFIVYITGSELSVYPSIGWLCTIDGAKYRVVSVKRTKPGKTVLLWTLTVER